MKPSPVAALHPRVVSLVAAKRRAALAAVVDSDDNMLARWMLHDKSAEHAVGGRKLKLESRL